MYRSILSVIFLVFCCQFSIGQVVIDGLGLDSTTFRFTEVSPSWYIADTAWQPLWQVGNSSKVFCNTDTSLWETLVTDTAGYYPANADNWFVVKIQRRFNLIVDVWHRYQTTRGHDGGAIEYSIDKGATWHNLYGECYQDGSSWSRGILADSFYGAVDTLVNGMHCFSGCSDSTVCTRIQFFQGYPALTTAGGSDCAFICDTLYLRFRFVSDSIPDSLSGWRIDSIRSERDNYGSGAASQLQRRTLQVYPNPSTNGVFHFPTLPAVENVSTTIHNVLGQQLLHLPYQERIDLSAMPKGLYYYSVTDGKYYNSGSLQRE
jgi:hypothetical protein